MNFMSCGWLWLYAGVALMFMELISPGFVIFFFGLAAVTVGLIWFVAGDAFSGAMQFVAFSLLSIAYLVLLRRWMKSVFLGDVEENALSGEYGGRIGKVVEAIRPPLAGRVEIGDSQWNAVADSPVDIGANVRVISQNNLTMKVEEVK